jgi:L-iditol 2-dehydrogenase
LKFIRILSERRVRVIAVGKRPSQMRAAERLGAVAAFDASEIENPVALVRQLTDAGRGADSVIEAVGRPETWQWALQMVRKGGTANLFGGCPRGTHVNVDPAALHYSEITIKSTFHHTPQFIREALDTIVRGEIRARDFITGEVPLAELPEVFQHMKNRTNGELKTAVIP